MSNRSKLRASARAAKLGPEDAAGVEFAGVLADLIDRTTPRTLAQIAAGERPMSVEDQLSILKVAGPLYLRTLTALGLTKAGRAVAPANTIPTAGSAAGASQDAAAHERHRQRFSERRSG